MNAGGKGNGGDGGGKAKKGGTFLDGLRSFGNSLLEGLANGVSINVSPSATLHRAGKPVVSRKDPVAERDRPVAVQHINRRLKIERVAADEATASNDHEETQRPNEEGSDATNGEAASGDAGTTANDEHKQDTSAAGDSDKQEGAPTDEANAEQGATKNEAEEQTTEPTDEGAGKTLSVAAKLRGVHRKVFRTANTPSSTAGGSAQTNNKVAFEPQSVPAGSEKLELQAGASGPAKLLIAGKEGPAALDGLREAFADATNRKGEDAVTAQRQIVVAAATSAKQVVIADGKVDKAALDSAKVKLSEAASAVSTLLQTFKAATLAEAAQTKPAKKQTLQFKVADWMAGNKYAAELDRQLKMQADGMSAMTVDKWVTNRETFKPSSVLNDLHESAKQEILKRLEARCTDGLPRAEARLKVVTEKKQKMIAAQQAIEAAATPEQQAQAAKDVASALKEETQLAAEIQGFIDAAAQVEAGKQGGKVDPAKMGQAGGRENAQRDFADKHRAAKEKLVALVGEHDQMVAEWDGLVAEAKDLAVLHDPDQIAGGHGDIEAFPAIPEPADKSEANKAAVDEWKTYLEKVKSHLGLQKVNGSIGSQWNKKENETDTTTRIETLYNNVTTDADCPQEVHPLRTMNVSFTSAAS